MKTSFLLNLIFGVILVAMGLDSIVMAIVLNWSWASYVTGGASLLVGILDLLTAGDIIFKQQN